MQAIRVEADSKRPDILLIDVVCDCGRNGLVNEGTRMENFYHAVKLGETDDDMLVCTCGKRYRLCTRGNLVYITP